MRIDLTERLDYLLGDTSYTEFKPEIIEPVEYDVPFSNTQEYNHLSTSYVNDVRRLSSYHNKELWFQCGDSLYRGENFHLLIKTRNNSKGVIANLNSIRHWAFINYVPTIDVAWEKKKDSVVWRGTTTGLRAKDEVRPDKYRRDHLVKEYGHKYDIGFSSIVQHAIHLRPHLKGFMPPEVMLQNKYIIVIDGNDKSSSLNWILTTNSVPIMCKPEFHSWLCEPWLEPDVHYVEVKPDFSNLDEKIEWCKDNDDKCKEIAANGRNFVLENFTDTEEQLYLEKEITRTKD